MRGIARFGFRFMALLGAAVAVGCASLFFTCPAEVLAAQQDLPPPLIRPVKLFSVFYGEEENQLGVSFPDVPEGVPREGLLGEGFRQFCVSWNGDLFYFLDVLNGDGYCLLKMFDKSGRLVRTIKVEPRWASYMTVSQRGFIYLYGSGEFAVFDAEGNYKEELSRHLTEQLRSAPVYCCSPSDIFTTDLEGNVYIKASEVVSTYREDIPLTEPRILRLSADLNGTYKVLPYGSVDRRGNIWNIFTEEPYTRVSRRIYRADGTLGHEEETYAFKQHKVVVYDTSGTRVREFQIPAQALDNIERNLTVDTSGPEMIDGRGHILMFLHPQELRWHSVVPVDLEVMRPIMVMEYDERGNRIGLRSVLGEYRWGAPGLIRQWEVDRDGNLYYLEFQKDRVDVMMVPPAPVVSR